MKKRDSTEFKIGDKVKCIKNWGIIFPGMTGTVVKLRPPKGKSGNTIGIDWDNPEKISSTQDHSLCTLGGDLSKPTGWYIPRVHVTLLDPKELKFTWIEDKETSFPPDISRKYLEASYEKNYSDFRKVLREKQNKKLLLLC